MATEILSVPEDHLADFIRVIRAGLKTVKGLPSDMVEGLTEWCDDEEEYLNQP